jgi:hypothetical protein
MIVAHIKLTLSSIQIQSQSLYVANSSTYTLLNLDNYSAHFAINSSRDTIEKRVFVALPRLSTGTQQSFDVVVPR